MTMDPDDDFATADVTSPYPQFTLDVTAARAIVEDMAGEDFEPGEPAIDNGYIVGFLCHSERPGQGIGDLLTDKLNDAITTPKGWSIGVDSIEDDDGYYYTVLVFTPQPHLALSEGNSEVREMLMTLELDEDGRYIQTVDGILRVAERLIEGVNQLIRSAYEQFHQVAA